MKLWSSKRAGWIVVGGLSIGVWTYTTPAIAGVFGFESGMTLIQAKQQLPGRFWQGYAGQPIFLGASKQKLPLSTEMYHQLVKDEVVFPVYRVTMAPIPHTLFKHYDLQFSKDHGLLSIFAESVPIQTAFDGGELVEEFKALVAQLEAKYGTFRKVDDISPHSLNVQPYMWMRSIMLNDRQYFAEWKAKTIGGRDGVVTIRVDAYATSESSGYLTLTVVFSSISKVNFKTQQLRYEEILKKQKAAF